MNPHGPEHDRGRAGSANLGIDVSFSPSSGDSPKDLTVILPPGLLANAAIDGGACLSNTSSTPVAACQVGTGTVTAAGLGIPLPITGVAGLLPRRAPQTRRPRGRRCVPHPARKHVSARQPSRRHRPPARQRRRSRAQYGVHEHAQHLLGLPISVDQLDTSFDADAPARQLSVSGGELTVSGDSYSDPTTRTASAPLAATNCGALPYAPKFAVTAAKDSADSGAKVVTKITQAADEATSRTVVLTLPPKVLTPNVTAVLTGGILCTSPSLAGCKTVGSASATSPLYPKTLTGKTYLTGSFTSPAITIVFPAPFALTLNGSVDLATNSTTFKQLPDIPLTALQVTLSGGPDAVFATTCAASSGTATSTLTTQNGDRTVTAPAAFMVSNYRGLDLRAAAGHRDHHGLRLRVRLPDRQAPPPGRADRPGAWPPDSRLPAPGRQRGPQAALVHGVAAIRPVVPDETCPPPPGPPRPDRLRRTDQVAGFKRGKLTVTLRAAVAGVTFKVGPRGLKEARRLRRRVPEPPGPDGQADRGGQGRQGHHHHAHGAAQALPLTGGPGAAAFRAAQL